MPTDVVILAQGQQSRLPQLDRPKQLLKLPACDATILHRTLVQLMMLDADAAVTVVCDDRIVPSLQPPRLPKHLGPRFDLRSCELADPGNSSLKGFQRYMAFNSPPSPPFDLKTVVLLGDVVYSWACLRQLFEINWDRSPIRFVGTTELTNHRGELWGFSWLGRGTNVIDYLVSEAMKKHPPAQVDDTYQPGQLRRLLWTMDESRGWRIGFPLDNRWWFAPCDDYTRDFDIPADLEHLSDVSGRAYDDDKQNGVLW